MPGRSHRIRGIVIGKTKLGESDLIVKLLADDGSLVESVAKGARRPQGSLSGKLDLFNEVDVLISEGKGLGIVKECRLVRTGPGSKADPVATSAAAVMAEFALKTSQVQLEVARFADLLRCALASLDGAGPEHSVAFTAAYLLKGTSILGARPHLSSCVICDGSLEWHVSPAHSGHSVQDGVKALFSYADGGVVCRSCAGAFSLELMDASIVEWAAWLIGTPFAGIGSVDISSRCASELLSLSCKWSEEALGVHLRSPSMLEAFALA